MRPKVSATPTCDTAPPLTVSIIIAPVPANTRQKVPKNSAISFFAILCGMRDDLHFQFQLAMLLAELFNLGANFFQQFPRFASFSACVPVNCDGSANGQRSR